MQIPKQFELAGQTIKVKYDPQMNDRDDSIWKAVYNRNEILLMPQSDCCDMNIDKMWRVFYHELMHHLLFTLWNKLYEDEVFVDNVAQLLYQYEKTKVL